MHRSQRPACHRLERVIGREYVGRGRSGREAARAALSGRACGAARTRDGNVEAIRALVVAKRSARSIKIKTLNQIRHLSYTAPDLPTLHEVGIGTAATLLVTAGDNPGRLRSEAAWAHLCGTAPIPASSGKVTRYRLNRGGDRAAPSPR